MPLGRLRIFEIELEKALHHVHEKRFSEPPGTRNQLHLVTRRHQRLNKGRFIHVITIIPNDVRKILHTYGQCFFHLHLQSIFSKSSLLNHPFKTGLTLEQTLRRSRLVTTCLNPFKTGLTLELYGNVS